MKLELEITKRKRPTFRCRGLIVMFLLASGALGQVPGGANKAEDVTVKTWSRGTNRVHEKNFHLNLGGKLNEYEIGVVDMSKTRRFRLKLNRIYTQTPLRASINCWMVSLHEVIPDKNHDGNIIGTNLLSVEGNGDGDSISKEDRAISFCSLEQPSRLFDDAFYPIDLTRTFWVENFSVIIKATNFHYDGVAKRLDILELDIQFKNR